MFTRPPRIDGQTKSKIRRGTDARTGAFTAAFGGVRMSASARERLQPWWDWRRKRFWLLVAVLVWTLFGFFGAPPLVERSIKSAIQDTGREIDIADVAINPYVLSLRIDGLEIRDPDSTPLIAFDTLFVNFQLSSLFRWAWTFDEIRLTGLHVEEERFVEGNTRLSRFSADLAGDEPPSEPENEDRQPPRLIIHSLTLEEGSLGVTDQLAGGFQDQFGPVTISANDIRTKPDHAGETHVSITLPAGGVLAWRGTLQLVPLASEGHLTVKGNGLPAALRYANHFLPVSIEGETIDMAFDYTVATRDGELAIAIDNLQNRTGAIHIRMDGAEQPFLDLASIEVGSGRLRWPELTAGAGTLTIDGLELDTWLDESGELNLLDALPPEDQADSAAAENTPGWSVTLDQVNLTGAGIDFEDRGLDTAGHVRVDDLAVTLQDVDNQDGTSIPTTVEMRLASGGSLSYTGAIQVLPQFRFEGAMSVSALALPVAQPWIQQFAQVNLSAGTLDLNADIFATPPEDLRLQGSTAVNGLEMSDTVRDARLAALERMAVDRFELDIGANTLKTAPVTLLGAFGNIHIYEDLTTNLGALAVETVEDAVAPGDSTDESSMDITIAGIEIENGALDFADDSLPLPFSTQIRQMGGTLSTLATASTEPSHVRLEGQVNEFGEARIEGSLNPWDFTQRADIAMIFRNLQMSTLTPYTVQYAGYAIEEGRLDMELSYVFKQRKLEGENSIVIRELVLGEKVETEDGTSLPLKLAVALLKDADGVIDVDLPVSGDLDDPTFKISGIVWKAIGNLITKIVTSPFRFLGGLVGVDSEDFGTLRFQPGVAAISPPDREQLAKLAEAMASRPELSLVVTGVYSESLDRPALQRQAFEAAFETRRAALLESGEAESFDADRAALEALFAENYPNTPLESVRQNFLTSPSAEGGVEDGESGETPPPVLDEPAYLAELRKRLIEAQEIDTTQLQALAAERAVAVFQALESRAGESPLAVTIADEVAPVEAGERQVELELEVEVRDQQDL